MISWDVKDFAVRNWEGMLASVSMLSSRKDRENAALVESDCQFYDFDKICEAAFKVNQVNHKKTPKSVDALFITGKTVELVEFKSGLIPPTPKDNFENMSPEVIERAREKAKNQRRELKDSLKLKAAESYVFLEKHVGGHPACKHLAEEISLNLTVVIDYEPVRTAENILKDAASLPTPKGPGRLTKAVEDEDLKRVKKALKQVLWRFQSPEGPNKQSYYYDHISIKSAQEYSAEIARLLMP